MPVASLGRFFVDENDRHVTVNGIRYRDMLERYFFQQLHELDISDMWFQQDGATSHTAGTTIELLKSQFGERVISRNGPVDWPPRSCDLTPLDFFYGATLNHWCMPTSRRRYRSSEPILNEK